jgi:drug/metabolite transporter (DMT)-like permease
MTTVPVTGKPHVPVNEAAGILFTMACMAIMAFVFTAGKILDGSVHAIQIMFLRYFSAFVFLLVVTFLRGGLRQHHTPRPLHHLIRACFGACGGGGAIFAATHMPIADAASIGMLKGMLTVVLAVFILKEVVSGRHWLAAILCAAGGAVVVFGQGSTLSFEGYGWAASIAFFSAITMAMETICIRQLALKERPFTMTFYVSGIGSFILAVPAWLVWHTPNWQAFLFLLALGPLAALAQTLNAHAYSIARASLLAPVGYITVVLSAIWGYFLFAEIPGISTWLGAALIAAGGIWLSRLSMRPA